MDCTTVAGAHRLGDLCLENEALSAQLRGARKGQRDSSKQVR